MLTAQKQAHGVELCLCLLPLLLFSALCKQTTAGIELECIFENLHASQRDIEVGLSIDIQGAHEAAVVRPLMVLELLYEAESPLLGQSADGWCRMQTLYQFARARIIK